MTNALVMIAGAALFFAGYWIGLNFEMPKHKPEASISSGVIGEVITNKEYQNFLSYDGSEQ